MIAPQANRWKLGLFVTLVGTLGVAALVAFGSTKLNRERIDMVTYFDETVQGLDEGSPLKWRGVTIGSVSHIGIAPDRRHVEVHVDVYSDLLRKMGVDTEKLLDPSGGARLRDNIGRDTRVRLVSAGITGLRFLELDRLPEAPLPQLDFEVPGNYVPSAPSVLAGLEVGLARTAEVLPDLLGSIDELVTSVDDVVAEFHAADLAATLSRILAWIENELRQLDAEGGPGHVAALTAELQRTLISVQGATVALQAQLQDADVSGTAAAVRDAATSVRALSNETGAPGAGLGEELRELRETLVRARELIETIERQPDALLTGRAREPDPEH